MTDTQENKLSMYIKTADFLGNHAGGLVSVTQIAGIKIELDAAIQNITDAAGLATSDTTGFTTEKAQERTDLEAITLKVSRATAAYFLSINNTGGIKLADYNKSELDTMRDTDLYVKAKYLHSKALPVQANLSDFNSGPADVTALNSKLAAYFAVIQLPQEKRGEKTVSVLALEEMMSATDLLLDTLDIYMLTFEAIDANLFGLYRTARAIDDTSGGGAAQIKTGTVPMNAQTNIPFSAGAIAADSGLELGNEGSAGQLMFYFSDSTTGTPGPMSPITYVPPNDITQVVAGSAGFDAVARPYLNVFNPNATMSNWRVEILKK